MQNEKTFFFLKEQVIEEEIAGVFFKIVIMYANKVTPKLLRGATSKKEKKYTAEGGKESKNTKCVRCNNVNTGLASRIASINILVVQLRTFFFSSIPKTSF